MALPLSSLQTRELSVELGAAFINLMRCYTKAAEAGRDSDSYDLYLMAQHCTAIKEGLFAGDRRAEYQLEVPPAVETRAELAPVPDHLRAAARLRRA
jgi:hypothetical protein